MMKPLEQWVCDTCGRLIESPDQGMLEWSVDELGVASGFRIVHEPGASPLPESGGTGGCQYRTDEVESLHDWPLSMYLGPAGLSELLTFLDSNPYLEPDYRGITFHNGREFANLIRRLHLPHYEEGRLYWEEALADDEEYAVYIHEGSGSAPFKIEKLKELIERYGPRDT